MLDLRRSPQAHMPPLDAEIRAMLDRVREVFGEEIVAVIYGHAQNVAIRHGVSPGAAATNASNDGRPQLVSDSTDDEFIRALRNELDRVLTQH